MQTKNQRIIRVVETNSMLYNSLYLKSTIFRTLRVIGIKVVKSFDASLKGNSMFLEIPKYNMKNTKRISTMKGSS